MPFKTLKVVIIKRQTVFKEKKKKKKLRSVIDIFNSNSHSKITHSLLQRCRISLVLHEAVIRFSSSLSRPMSLQQIHWTASPA